MTEDFSILSLEGYLNFCDFTAEDPQWIQCYCRINNEHKSLDIFQDETMATPVNSMLINNEISSVQLEGTNFSIYKTFDPQQDGNLQNFKIAEFQAQSIEEANKWSEIIRTLTRSNPTLSMDDFNIISVLGRGFFGKVMLVQHKQTKELFAIKTVRKKRLLESGRPQTIIAERNIMMLIKNPFIIQLHFAFQTATKFYLGLEYAPGGELFYHMQQFGLIPLDDARLYIAEIAIALDHLHRLGIVYRDLKPENILFDIDGHVKLTDFGLAKELESEEQSTTTFCGTNHYLAPEIVLKQPYSYEIDWWALGVLLCEMLTGFAPFTAENKMVMYQKIVHDKPVLPSDIDEEAGDLILHLLTKNPKQRPKFEEISVHPFFSCLDWDNVYNKRYAPNFVPENIPPVPAFPDPYQSQYMQYFPQMGQNPYMQQPSYMQQFQQPPYMQQFQQPPYMQQFQQTQQPPYMQQFQQTQQPPYMQQFQQAQQPPPMAPYFPQQYYPQQAQQPMIPQQNGQSKIIDTLTLFPPEFTAEEAVDSQCDVGQSCALNFDGFSYIAPPPQTEDEIDSAIDVTMDNGVVQELQKIAEDSDM